MPENLWAPWRLSYISEDDKMRDGCFLCQAAEAHDDAAALVLGRGETVFCLMNKYPYSNGHLMVAPKRHGGDICALTAQERAETIDMICRATDTLRAAMRCHGFNIGWNVGAAAGAGVAAHLHAHVVPRWEGDTNFMPVIANAKVIPQALDETYRKLRENWPGR